jgi:hypothetical protein
VFFLVRSHNDLDIQSGKGAQGNCLLFQNVYKSVVYGVFCDSMVTKVFQQSKKSPAIREAFANLQCRQTVGALARLVKSMMF